MFREHDQIDLYFFETETTPALKNETILLHPLLLAADGGIWYHQHKKYSINNLFNPPVALILEKEPALLHTHPLWAIRYIHYTE